MDKIFRHILLWIFLIPCIPHIVAQEAPRLFPIYAQSFIYCPPRKGSNHKYQPLKGLLIEGNIVKESYPLLPIMFFDSNNSQVPQRYYLFTDTEQCKKFNDSTIPGGTLNKYYHLLNIIGYRMRNNPLGSITLKGSYLKSRESATVAKERVEVIKKYLVDIWKIESQRIQAKPAQVVILPANDTMLAEESMCVEITSNDWEIMRPITQIDARYYPQPDSIHFLMENTISVDSITDRYIEIRRHNKIWAILPERQFVADTSAPYNWGKENNEDILPTDEAPFITQLVILTKGGRRLVSDTVSIPILIYDNERKIRAGLVDSVKDRFILNLFSIGNSQLSKHEKQIIKTYIIPEIFRSSKINITGYCSSWEPSKLKGLGVNRAKAVEKAIRNSGMAFTSIYSNEYPPNDMGHGPLYDNVLPEGRYFNRTVEISISSVSSDRK